MNASDLTEFPSEDEMASWIEGMQADFRDGEASAADVEKLRHLLLENATARRLYLDGNELSVLLETAAGYVGVQDESPSAARKLSKISKLVLWTSGAAVVMILGALWYAAHTKPQPLARLSVSHEAVLSGSALRGDSEYGPGTLALSAGVAQLELSNGVQIILEEGARLKLVDENTVLLDHGKIRVRCPLEARGFEVLAPGNHRIVDLGTEFGVHVNPAGELGLHVFDGHVDLFPNKLEKRTVEAGVALAVSASNVIVESEADDSLFTSLETLRQKRWEAHQRAMLQRDDLLLYYDFAEVGFEGVNRAGADALGEVFGASRVAGRASGKSGLLFEQPGDRLAFELQPQTVTDGFTIAMWIKVDRLEHRLSTLLNSNGWDVGDIHFQITKGGNLRSGIRGLGAFETVSETVSLGAWRFVAVSWIADERAAQFYFDGKLCQAYEMSTGLDLGQARPEFGSCQIGAWGDPTFHYPLNRDFKGRIDEVMIFSRSLADTDIEALYEQSKP